MSLPQQRNRFLRDRFRPARPASPDTVVLVDVDSAIPNLALMKLSRHFKNEARDVILTRDSRPHRRSRFVYASCVFRRGNTAAKLRQLRDLHGQHLRLGGSGTDPASRLPEEIEKTRPDLSLYGGVSYAMGFLTRGCPHRCSFCIVPRKDGPIRQVAAIADLVPAGYDRLVLLDDNLLAFSGCNELLAEMVRRKLRVNFNQTLDLRHLTPEAARLLTEIDSCNIHFSRRMYYFSLNSASRVPMVEEKLRMLPGVKGREMTFVSMYGHRTTLSDDVERFSFIQRLRAIPFTQRYRPINGPPPDAGERYFDCDPEPLARMHFVENGRNFERFLKWVSAEYAKRFGNLHMPLVDRIFQYNFRDRKAAYVETLAGTRRLKKGRRSDIRRSPLLGAFVEAIRQGVADRS